MVDLLHVWLRERGVCYIQQDSMKKALGKFQRLEPKKNARVAKLADALDLGSSGITLLRVRPPLRASFGCLISAEHHSFPCCLGGLKLPDIFCAYSSVGQSGGTYPARSLVQVQLRAL